MRPGGVRIRSQQSIDGLLREQTAGTTEVIEEILIVRPRRQCRLKIGYCFRQLASLNLCDSQASFVVNLLKMWDCFGGVALREQRVAQKLMCWRHVRINL